MNTTYKNILFGLTLIGTAIISPMLVSHFNAFDKAVNTKTDETLLPMAHASGSPTTTQAIDIQPTHSSHIQPTQHRLSFADAVEKAAPAVVSIHTKKAIKLEVHPLYQDPFYRNYFYDPNSRAEVVTKEMPGLGSGVLINQAGYILTNNHVIQGADEIEVRLNDGRQINAKIVGSDQESDLAVLKIEGENLPFIQVGDSKKLRVGDIALAIGYPFGVGHTVTQGIVSATQRHNLGLNIFDNFIQTDASINPGNSGGALINAEGELIGINTAILSKSGGNNGIGFAIPIHLAQNVMAELMQNGHITRGWLGVSLQSMTPQIAQMLNTKQNQGAVIENIVRGGPAHVSGLEPLDVITHINHQPITKADELLKIITSLTPDKPVPISIIRKGQPYDFNVIIGRRPTLSS